jgi:hypothetical protein
LSSPETLIKAKQQTEDAKAAFLTYGDSDPLADAVVERLHAGKTPFDAKQSLKGTYKRWLVDEAVVNRLSQRANEQVNRTLQQLAEDECPHAPPDT